MAWFDHNSTRIYYETYGTGSPVLLLPGFAGTIEDLSAVSTVLSETYQVIVADLPGSGRSEPQPRTYTASYYRDDAHIFIAFLQEHSIPSAHIVGFSDGGEVALLMAELNPDLVRSVVTWGAAGVIHDPNGQLRNTMDTVVDDPIPPLQPFSTYLKATYGETNARAMTQSFVRAMSDIIAQGGDISLSQSKEIRCPALLITGEHDFIALPALVAQLADSIHLAEFLEADGAGHNIHHEKPEWLSRTIYDWLQVH